MSGWDLSSSYVNRSWGGGSRSVLYVCVCGVCVCVCVCVHVLDMTVLESTQSERGAEMVVTWTAGFESVVVMQCPPAGWG